MTRYHGAPVRATTIALTGARPWMQCIFQPLKVRSGKKKENASCFSVFPAKFEKIQIRASFRYKLIQSHLKMTALYTYICGI